MNAEGLLKVYEQISEAPDAVARLRRFVLDLAVRGKLVEQDAGDEPASVLLAKIAETKQEILKASDMRKPRKAPEMDPKDIWAELPSNWVWTQISNLGFISPRNDEADDTEASFVPMPLIAAEYGATNGHEPRQWGAIKKGYTHFSEEDVGLAKITPCFENGKSTVFRNLTGGFGSGTTELHVLRPVLVDPDFVVLFLKSPQFIETGIPRMTGTAGQKRVPSEFFTSYPFPLPPLAEQHRIVAKVDELMGLCDRLEAARVAREEVRDKLTAASLARLTAPDAGSTDTSDQTTKASEATGNSSAAPAFHTHARFALDTLPALTSRPDQIKTLRQTILNLAVRGKLVEQDSADEPVQNMLPRLQAERERLREAKGLKRQKPAEPADGFENFAFLPPTWMPVYLQDIAYQITDGTHLTPKYTERGRPFLSAQNVKPFRFMPEQHRFVSSEDFEKYRANRKPERGDVLLTRVGAGIGEAAVLNSDFEFAFYVSLCLIKFPQNFLLPDYLVLWLNSPEGRENSEIRTYGKGASQGNLNLGLIRTFKVPLPPLAEQHRIVAKVDALMALCDRLEAALTTADTTRTRLLNALLHEALTPATPIPEAAE